MAGRLGLPAPAETDPADVPLDITKLRDALDAIAMVFSQGTQAAIPAAGVAGRMYYATDSRALFYDDGAHWQSAVTATGDIKMSASAVVPGGWLLCDGTAYARTDYANLYGAIGVAFGAGDGSTTFNVPDLRGRTPIGAGTGTGLTARALGSRGGEEAHALTVAEMASHAHGVSDPGHAHSLADPGHAHTTPSQVYNNTSGPLAYRSSTVASGGWGMLYAQNLGTDARTTGMGMYGAATGVSVQAAGGNGNHNNMPPFQAVNWFIKT